MLVPEVRIIEELTKIYLTDEEQSPQGHFFNVD